MKDDTKFWSRLVLALVALAACITLVFLSGCKAFYENAGSHTKVGSLTAPIEVSDGSDSITVKALYSMDGADVYTAKDSLVKIRYSNAYTNDYFAIVKTQGKQDLEVEIEPLASEPTIDAADPEPTEPTTSATSARQAEPTEPTQEAQEGDKDVK